MSSSLLTIRQQLAASRPHVSMKVATRTLLQQLRADHRAHATVRHPLADRAALERLLDRVLAVPTDRLVDAKTALADMVAADDPSTQVRCARLAADVLWGIGPAVLDENAQVTVRLVGGPPQFGAAVAHQLLGDSDGTMTARAAALAVHRLDGTNVGGARLAVQVDIPEGSVLPTVPRDQRADRGRWGRGPAWLPFLDDVGQRSLTPEGLARAMAADAVVPAAGVVDACCGCGGNAVAFGWMGATVIGIERDAPRALLAQQNVASTGVGNRVRIVRGDVESALHQHWTPDQLLFVDPPWEPTEDGRAVDFGDMFAALPTLAAAIAEAPYVMLKLPRTFAVHSLPGGADSWALSYRTGTEETGDARVVRLITASRPARENPDARAHNPLHYRV